MSTSKFVPLPVPTGSGNSLARTRGRPFRRGLSGNPNGRPKGARNKATLAAQSLLDGEAENILRKCVELANAGNIPALKLCLERILPPRRERHVPLELPKIETAGDAAKASWAVLAACAEGNLSIREATDFIALIGKHIEILELSEIEDRLIALEKKVQP